MTHDILSHQEGAVLTLTLHRPEKKNAFTQAMYQSLTERLRQAAQDASVRVLVIQGQIHCFSAGNDIADFVASTEQPGSGLPDATFAFMKELAQFPKPLVAIVCGPCVGIGTTLLLHCDLVVAGDNAVFALPFVNIGLCLEAGSSLLLPALMGYHRAAEALLLGEPFFAEAAMDAGLVNRIVPPDEANGIGQALAQRIAAKPLEPLLATKRLLKADQLPEVLRRIDAEAEELARLLQQPAAKEAFRAFLEKRKPDFSGL